MLFSLLNIFCQLEELSEEVQRLNSHIHTLQSELAEKSLQMQQQKQAAQVNLG